MIVVSNIKQRFGQDLPYVQERIEELNSTLNRLLLNPRRDEREVTYVRGRLLRYMQQEIDLTQDPILKQQKKAMLNFEINRHKQQLSSRIRVNKISHNNSIMREIGLKIQRTVNAYKQILLSGDKREVVGNIANSLGNTISLVGSVAKIPALAVTRVLSTGARLTAKIITLPVHVPAYLFGKLINPDSPYRGRTVETMSQGLERMIRSTMEMQEQAIRRM